MRIAAAMVLCKESLVGTGVVAESGETSVVQSDIGGYRGHDKSKTSDQVAIGS